MHRTPDTAGNRPHPPIEGRPKQLQPSAADGMRVLQWLQTLIQHCNAHPEQRLAEQDPASAAMRIRRAWSESDAFWRAVRYHQLIPLATWAAWDQALPPMWLDAERSKTLQRVRDVEQLAERVHQELAALQVPALILKGIAFGQRYWGEMGLRQVRDLDILVRPEALAVVCSRLCDQGFRSKGRSVRPGRRERRLEHGRVFEKGDARIDLHWKLRDQGDYRLDEQGIWQRAQGFPCGRSQLSTLSMEDDLIFVSLSIAHDLQRAAIRFKSLMDLYLILRAAEGIVDWNQFGERCSEERTLPYFTHVLAVVASVLPIGSSLPGLSRLLEKHAVTKHRLDSEKAGKLLLAQRGARSNQQWFNAICGTRSLRGWLRFADKNLLSPGRIPWLVIKALRTRAA